MTGAKNIFGPDEWTGFFGGRFNLDSIPEIPWSQTEIEKPGIKQEHFLFLVLDRLEGMPLNLSTWYHLYRGGAHPKFFGDWYLIMPFAQDACEYRWYNMPTCIVEGSDALSYSDQVALLPDEYEVPTVTERVTANILYFLLNGRYLDTDCSARVSNVCICGCRLYVQAHLDDGIYIYHWDDEPHSGIGIAASRKL